MLRSRAVTSRIFLQNRLIFLHSCAKCTELPSNLSTMILPNNLTIARSRTKPFYHGSFIRWFIKIQCAHVRKFDCFNAFVYFTGKEKSWHKMSFFKVVLHARAGVSDQPSFKDTIHFIDSWKNLLWITAKINTMFLTSH